jgi:molybdopterin converting factor small subunit
MKILYFAWLKGKVGIGEEAVTPPAEVATVGALLDWLASRAGLRRRCTRQPGLSCASPVNQEYAGADHPVKAGDEGRLFSCRHRRLEIG